MNPSLLLVPCAVVIVTVIVMVVKQTKHVASRVLLALAAVVAGWVSYRVVMPPPPLAEAQLAPGGPGLDVEVHDSSLALLVRGEVKSGEGRYQVAVRADDAPAEKLEGNLERKTTVRKIMKRGKMPVEIKHLERRHELPLAHQKIHVDVLKEDGALSGPLAVSVIPRPPPELPIFLFGLLAVSIGAFLDRKLNDAKSYGAIGIGVLFAFALLLLEAPHPLAIGYLLRMTGVAVLFGAVVGGGLRAFIGLFMKKPPSTSLASRV